MEIKHIRWIAVVGLIAIVELQYVWLVNTYKLTKESIQMKGEELFPEAALQEVFLRVSKTKKDSTVTMNVNFDAEKDMETMSNPGQWLMSYIPQFGIRIVHKKVGSFTNILYLYR